MRKVYVDRPFTLACHAGQHQFCSQPDTCACVCHSASASYETACPNCSDGVLPAPAQLPATVRCPECHTRVTIWPQEIDRNREYKKRKEST